MIPFRLELPYEIGDDNENDENGVDHNDYNDEDDDLSPVPFESEEADYMC